MRVTIQLFAAARELVGSSQATVELPAGATVGDLRQALTATYPALAPLLQHTLFAVDAEYAGDDALIDPSAEVACIPPVSGG